MLIDELLLPEVPDGKNGFRAAAKTIEKFIHSLNKSFTEEKK